jgi:hypothetical protein
MIALLNALAPGESMPLVHFANKDLPSDAFINGYILSAIPIAEDSDRYLNAELSQVEIDIDENGTKAMASGSFRVSSETIPTTVVWVLAVAYDHDGIVTGVRRFEHIGEITSGTEVNFSLWVYSLGQSIQNVDVLIEARP